MKRHLVALALLFSMAGLVSAQAPYRVFTSPKLPMRDALQRMNLTTAWTTRVTVDGNRDGLASVQIVPGKNPQVVVQTFKGAVYLFDADNGDLVWKTQVGVPFWAVQAAAFNAHNIFVTRRNMLYVLNREDGAHRAFTFNSRTEEYTFGAELSYAPSATPIADEDFIYFPMGNRVHAIDVHRDTFGPRKPKTKNGRAVFVDEIGRETFDSPQPEFYWGYSTGNQLVTSAPLIFNGQLSILTGNGELTSLPRFNKGRLQERFEFRTTGNTPAGAGQHQHIAYLASDDFNLYAVDMQKGDLLWRYASGAPIKRKPEVTDRDIYVAPERVGLRRLHRATGRIVWTNRDTSRFLAANNDYVYALNHHGEFFVLDHRRGTTLAKLDLSNWAINVPNEWTDRVYLAANDGQILCLRHRDLKNPLFMKALPEWADVKVEPKPPPKKKVAPKEDARRQLPLGDARLLVAAPPRPVLRVDAEAFRKTSRP
ncbi:MAG: PQQ-binding-like beta-propeller repeat protein [Planctomycetes bacterium]|nr:PQQ-binding-like beta-propeller repeat protein [Planctomycetota bacterium]